MTTRFLDKKIVPRVILLSWRFPRKTVFWGDFPLCPQSPPPSKNTNLHFIVVLPSLTFPQSHWKCLHLQCFPISDLNQSQLFSSIYTSQETHRCFHCCSFNRGLTISITRRIVKPQPRSIAHTVAANRDQDRSPQHMFSCGKGPKMRKNCTTSVENPQN